MLQRLGLVRVSVVNNSGHELEVREQSVVPGTGMRVMKDQAPKLSGESTAVKSLRDSSSSSSSSKKFQTRRFSVTIIDSKGGAFEAEAEKSEKVKKAEESLRTVMYLSCWGPN